MNIFSFVPPELYYTIYLSIILLLCLGTSLVLMHSEDSLHLLYRSNPILQYGALVLTIFFILFLGLRPIHPVFVDTVGYATMYEVLKEPVGEGYSGDWLWHPFLLFCRDSGFDVNQYFLIIESIYIGCMALASIFLIRNNLWIAILFLLSSFSFFGGAVNGLRNGMALSMVMCGIALLTKFNKWSLISVILFFLASGIHKSSILPAVCSIIACIIYKKPSIAIHIWFISIILSIIAGNVVGDYFVSLGFDDRMESYFNAQYNVDFTQEDISRSRFRWDFLLYSSLPVLFSWYLNVKRNFKDRTFNIIAATYILANSFWILVIRASFSNRFAYLSWFIYPIVIAYPLLKMNIWDNQGKVTAVILLLYSGFTFTMFLLTK